MTLEYNSASEFNSAVFMCIQNGSFSEHNETLSSFINIMNGLSGGCSCTRKKRMDQANRLYLNMSNILTESQKNEFKKFFSADEVVLKFDNEVFLVI